MKNTQKGPLIISGNAHNNLAIDIANYIGQDLTKAEVFKFNNDNTFVKILEYLVGFILVQILAQILYK